MSENTADIAPDTVTLPSEQVEQMSMALMVLISVLRSAGGKIIVSLSDLDVREGETTVSFVVNNAGTAAIVSLTDERPAGDGESDSTPGAGLIVPA